MCQNTEKEKREEFRNILYELAKSQSLFEETSKLDEMCKKIQKLYEIDSEGQRFRHFYSDIFSVLAQVRQNSKLGDINVLVQNLEIIRNYYTKQNLKDKWISDVSDAIKKLYDHVNLDVARIAYSEAADWKISGEPALQEVRKQIQHQKEMLVEIEQNRKLSESKIDGVKNKLDNSQKEYIAILGIFASIVLTFIGGITFSTSVLENIEKVSIYRTVLVSLIIGLVLINILYGLFYYINSLVNKEKKLYPLVISNIVIVVLLVIIIIAWYLGFVENRNIRINNQENISACNIKRNEETIISLLYE